MPPKNRNFRRVCSSVAACIMLAAPAGASANETAALDKALFGDVVIEKAGPPKPASTFYGRSADEIRDLVKAKATLTEVLRRPVDGTGPSPLQLLTPEFRHSANLTTMRFFRLLGAESSVISYRIAGYTVDHAKGEITLRFRVREFVEGEEYLDSGSAFLRKDAAGAWRIHDMRRQGEE